MKHNHRFGIAAFVSPWSGGRNRGGRGRHSQRAGPARAPRPAVQESKTRGRSPRSIDRLLAARWAEAKVQPARPADDAEYLRRVYLDLGGQDPHGRRGSRLPR